MRWWHGRHARLAVDASGSRVQIGRARSGGEQMEEIARQVVARLLAKGDYDTLMALALAIAPELVAWSIITTVMEEIDAD